MSERPPSEPARFDPKNIVELSCDSVARASIAELLTRGPRLVGIDQLSAVVSRLDVQMSYKPKLPGRFESKTTSSPSLRTFGRTSLNGLLSPVSSCAGPKSTLK
jgi:hypothetical protein